MARLAAAGSGGGDTGFVAEADELGDGRDPEFLHDPTAVNHVNWKPEGRPAINADLPSPFPAPRSPCTSRRVPDRAGVGPVLGGSWLVVR